jgi:hypothetical protein
MKVHNFQGYLKSKVSNRLLEEEDCGSYGANPEEEMENDSNMNAEDEFDLGGDLEGEESEEEEEEVTLEDLKAMLDDISSRVSALEGGEEGMEDEEEEEDIEDEDIEDEDVEEEEEEA